MSASTEQSRYQMTERVGAGSLFTVYRARDAVRQREVIVKVLRREYANNREFAAALLRAAQESARLHHTNLAAVHLAAQDQGHCYLVTDYIVGSSLHQRLMSATPLDCDQALSIGIQVCAGLRCAHENGICHGDLRPRNILLDRRDEVKLTDFGLADAFSAATVLQNDALLRSTHYMAPERLSHQPPSPAADIYSLGVVLYQMLSGRLPFDNGDFDTPPPSLRQFNPSVPAELEQVILHCLHRSPRDRYRDVSALAEDLERVRQRLRSPSLQGLGEDEGGVLPLPPSRKDRGGDPAVRRLVLGNLLWIILLLAAFWAAVRLGLYFLTSTGPKDVLVPEIVGLQLERAEKLVNDAGLIVRVARETFDEKTPEGAVVECDPAPGRTVKTGRVVNVVVSRGAEAIPVPDVRQLTVDQAQSLLTRKRLKVGEVSEAFHELVSTGHVIRQSPSPGARVRAGESVDLIVSKGADTEGQTPPPPPPGAPPKKASVSITVPDGPPKQSVRIVVVDDSGERQVYSDYHRPGDKVSQRVVGYGAEVWVRVYVAGVLMSEKKL